MLLVTQYKMVETLYDIEIVATNLAKEFEKIARKK